MDRPVRPLLRCTWLISLDAAEGNHGAPRQAGGGSFGEVASRPIAVSALSAWLPCVSMSPLPHPLSSPIRHGCCCCFAHHCMA
jgi:hypothetical protein